MPLRTNHLLGNEEKKKKETVFVFGVSFILHPEREICEESEEEKSSEIGFLLGYEGV